MLSTLKVDESSKLCYAGIRDITSSIKFFPRFYAVQTTDIIVR